MSTTLNHRAWQDEQRVTVQIAKAREETPRCYVITMVTGVVTYTPDLPEGCPIPQRGDLLTLWGSNAHLLGGAPRGKALNGHVIFYRTESEDQAYREAA